VKKLKIIKKKAWPVLFEKVLSGKKKFDIRLADFDIKEGNILILEEYNPKTKQYTGRIIKKKVGYILSTKSMEKMYSKKEIEKYGFNIIQLEDDK